MTITEVVNYTLEVYLERGWITNKKVKQIKREDSVLFWGLFVVVLLGITFFIVVFKLEGLME